MQEFPLTSYISAHWDEEADDFCLVVSVGGFLGTSFRPWGFSKYETFGTLSVSLILGKHESRQPSQIPVQARVADIHPF